MNARRLGALALLAGAGILFVRWLRQWAGDPPLQRTSHKEAIERPENVASYSRFMGLLPLRLIRGYLAHYAAAGSVQWRVLDVGCGPGWFPLELAGQAPDAVVIGVDLSYPMIAEAVGHAEFSQEKQRVLFAQARGEDLAVRRRRVRPYRQHTGAPSLARPGSGPRGVAACCAARGADHCLRYAPRCSSMALDGAQGGPIGQRSDTAMRGRRAVGVRCRIIYCI